MHCLQPDESAGAVSWKRSEYPGDLRAAMSVAMRPGGAAAGAREPHIRAVEPGEPGHTGEGAMAAGVVYLRHKSPLCWWWLCHLLLEGRVDDMAIHAPTT